MGSSRRAADRPGMVLARRLRAQLLSGPPARDPVAVARRLLAIQGQDPRGARLAVRARSCGLSAGDVDRALTEERSLLITWLNRGTLHLVASDDYPWLHALTTPPLLSGNTRRLGQEGVSPDDAERAIGVIERSLARDGPMSRAALRERVGSAGVRTEGQAFVHILFLASLRGLIVRGPMVGGEHAYVLVRDWVGEVQPVERSAALGELARRYLTGHGPAREGDLARWAGLPLRDARAGLERIARELVQEPGGLVDLAQRSGEAGPAAPRLLGSFDPILLGWSAREEVVGPAWRRIVSGGVFRPFALVDGRARALWSLRGGEVVLEPFGELSAEHSRALQREARDVERFLSGA